jgi:hypothetical protein
VSQDQFSEVRTGIGRIQQAPSLRLIPQQMGQQLSQPIEALLECKEMERVIVT